MFIIITVLNVENIRVVSAKIRCKNNLITTELIKMLANKRRNLEYILNEIRQFLHSTATRDSSLL